MGGGDSGRDHGSGVWRRTPQTPPPAATTATGRQPRPPEQQRSGGGARIEVASRERVFQSVEGLLRQIREQAEESSQWTEAELREITQTVTTFTKSLEQESDPISDRVRLEYDRIREKLSQALNRGGPSGPRNSRRASELRPPIPGSTDRQTNADKRRPLQLAEISGRSAIICRILRLISGSRLTLSRWPAVLTMITVLQRLAWSVVILFGVTSPHLHPGVRRSQ